MKDGADFQGFQHGNYMLKIPFIDAAGFIGFPAECLYLMNPGKVVLQLSVKLAHFLLGNAEIRTDLLREDHPGEQNQRNGRTGDDGKLPVDGQQNDQDAGKGDQVGDGLRDHVGVQKLEVARVIHNPAHKIPGLLVMKIAQMHMLQLVIGPGSQITHQIPGGFVRQVIAQKTEQDTQQIQADQDHRKRPDPGERSPVDAIADDPRHLGKHPWCRKIDHGKGQCGQNRDNVERAVADRFA